MIFRMVKNLDRFFFLFVTMHAFERQTDRRTEFSSLDRAMECRRGLRVKNTGMIVLPSIANKNIELSVIKIK